MDVPMEVAAPVGVTLVAAVGTLVAWVKALYARIDDLQEKRLADRDPILAANRDTTAAMAAVAKEMELTRLFALRGER